jgi:hypothetical protein
MQPSKNEKQRLRRKVWVKCIGWAMLAILFLLLATGVISLWILMALVLPMLILDLLPREDYFLTDKFIQRGTTKLLYSDLEEVRTFIFWYIIIDQYDELICIPYGFLEDESCEYLNRWLGINPSELHVPAQQRNT